LSAAFAVALAVVRADPNVIVSATANPDYTREKYAAAATKRETYIIAQGTFFEGRSVDGSIDALPFRNILGVLAPELARRHYFPAKDARDSDLLIAVHWGTTQPTTSLLEMTARNSAVSDTSRPNGEVEPKNVGDTVSDVLSSVVNEPLQRLRMDQLEQESDQLAGEMSAANNAALLGYTKALRQAGNALTPPEVERSLRYDLAHERYFIILKAYDLRQPAAGGRRRVLWSLHLNMSSAGNNFDGALRQMGTTAVDYFGRSTTSVETVRPLPRDGRVDVGTPVIVGEKK
jgi:hypothetical protein